MRSLSDLTLQIEQKLNSIESYGKELYEEGFEDHVEEYPKDFSRSEYKSAFMTEIEDIRKLLA